MRNFQKNTLLLFFTILFIGFVGIDLFAQSFSKTYLVDDGAALGKYIQPIANNEYLVAGRELNLSVESDTVMSLMKINSTGDEIWTQTINSGYGGEQRPSIVENTASEIYFVGNQRLQNAEDAAIIVVKFDAMGQQIWQQTISNGIYDKARQVIFTDNEDLLIIGTSENAQGDRYMSGWRMDSEGQMVWSNIYTGISESYGSAITTTMDGNFVIAGGRINNNGLVLLKIDEFGSEIWTEEGNLSTREEYLDIKEDNLGNLVIAGRSATEEGAVLKTDAAGQEIWKTDFPQGQNFITSLKIEADNQITVAGSDMSFAYVFRVSEAGEILTSELVAASDTNVQIIEQITDAADGGELLVGWKETDQGYAIWVQKSEPTTNNIVGQIAYDLDLDCQYSILDKGTIGWYIQAQDGDDTYLAATDENGFYQLSVPAGDFEITIIPPVADLFSCEPPFPISFQDEGGIVKAINFPFINFGDCPYLHVQIGNNWDLRICEESTYYVNYCNYSFVTGEDAYIEIALDEYQTFVESSIPLSGQMGDTLIFDIGDIEGGVCGDFTITTMLACDTSIVGFTHCTEAHIFPDDACETSGDWSGASLEITGICEDGMINFFARNVGTVTTTATLNFVVIEDQVIYLQGGIDNLMPQEEELIASIPATGATYRVIAQQEPGHPGESIPTFFVEGCTANSSQPVSTGFVNTFPANDADIFIDVSCVENAYPYDPNDKLAVPYGSEEEHFIQANQQIEYTIRFQNTGTAPAFKVVIRDSLPTTLDPVTLRSGASSHPYTFTMEGDGVAIFTFEDINLPDSTTNFAASQGFVKFNIQQEPDLPNGTLIENNAAIFFDLASPVITPTWFHTVGEDLIIINEVSSEFKALSIDAFPNPFTDYTNIVLKGVDLPNLELKLFDAVGRLIKIERFENNRVELSRTDLTSGVYFFIIESEGEFIGNGKLMIRD